jgi:hypothetical protein
LSSFWLRTIRAVWVLPARRIWQACDAARRKLGK